MKIGLIQSRGIGDIVIALPIAKYFVDRGNQVFWPIHEDFIAAFRPAAPYVEFIPLPSKDSASMFETPLGLLQAKGCDAIIPLYSYLGGRTDIINVGLASIHKFDEYKYAVAGVPFREKWNLQIVRDRNREEALFKEVVRQPDYVVCQLEGSNTRVQVDMSGVAKGRQVVEITPRTDSIFDWLTVIERASARVMIDSCFSNLTDQLGIEGPKTFIRRSPVQFTPVLLGDWRYAG